MSDSQCCVCGNWLPANGNYEYTQAGCVCFTCRDLLPWKARAEQAEAELKHCRESNRIGEKQRSKHIAERVKAEAREEELKAEVERLTKQSDDYFLCIAQMFEARNIAMSKTPEDCLHHIIMNFPIPQGTPLQIRLSKRLKEWKSQTGGGDE